MKQEQLNKIFFQMIVAGLYEVITVSNWVIQGIAGIDKHVNDTRLLSQFILAIKGHVDNVRELYGLEYQEKAYNEFFRQLLEQLSGISKIVTDLTHPDQSMQENIQRLNQLINEMTVAIKNKVVRTEPS